MKNTIIPGDRIESGSITNQQIASGTITNSQIASGTITGSNIASGTITGSNIAPNTITGSNIAPKTITQSNIAPPSTNTLNGTTAGSITYIQVSSFPTYQKYLMYANGYENDTTTNQSITYPTAFSTVAVITVNTTGLTVSTSLTELTITAPNNTNTYTGVIIVEGY